MDATNAILEVESAETLSPFSFMRKRMVILLACFILLGSLASANDITYLSPNTAMVWNGSALLANMAVVNGINPATNTLTDCGGLEGMFSCGLILNITPNQDYMVSSLNPISGSVFNSLMKTTNYMGSEIWATLEHNDKHNDKQPIYNRKLYGFKWDGRIYIRR